MNEGYEKFNATTFREGVDRSSNDENCKAELYYGAENRIFGKTGTGHAEMDALELFLKNICRYNAETFESMFPISISCEEKPCCLYCSAMMGLLTIVPHTETTRKIKKRMGKTQWGGLSAPSLKFVARLIGQQPRLLNGWDGQLS